MSDPYTWIYIITLAVGAGTAIYQGRQTAKFEAMQREKLKGELKTQELETKRQHIELLEELQYVNAEISAGGAARGIDAYASPSLTALREFNFRAHGRNVNALNLNIASQRAATSVMLRMSRLRGRTAETAGLLGGVSTIGQGAYDLKRLQTPEETPTKKKKKDTTGRGQ